MTSTSPHYIGEGVGSIDFQAGTDIITSIKVYESRKYISRLELSALG